MKKLRITAFIILCLIAFTSSGCINTFRYSIGCAQIRPDQEFSFFVVSDIHHLSKSLYDNGKAFENFLMSGDGKLLKYTEELLDALIEEVTVKKPDFLVITGDLTCNGELKSHMDILEKLKSIENMGTCVFVLPGNHDILNPWANSYLGSDETPEATITEEDFIKLYSPFGYDEAISKDDSSFSYLAMPTSDTWLLMLDSSDHNRNLDRKYPEKGGVLLPETLEWMEQCAKLAKKNNARLIAVMHHSLIDHSSLVNKDYTVRNSDEVLRLFYRYGIEMVMTGHIHLQDIKTKEKNGKMVYDIATGSLSVYPHQYGRIDFKPGSGYLYSTKKLNISEWAMKNNISDEVLRNFESYSSGIFMEQCCKNYSNCMKELAELPVNERDKAISAFTAMNLMYFAGYRNETLKESVDPEGYGILENMHECFTKAYIMSMLNDERRDNNSISIEIKE
ncbi:MAG: metallophosphoesterase [Pseudomonadota bacterium]